MYWVYNQAIATAQIIDQNRMKRAGYIKKEDFIEFMKNLPKENPSFFKNYGIKNAQEFSEEIVELFLTFTS